MKPEELAEARDALTGTFSPDEFDMFLYERLNFDRAVEVPDGSFRLVVWNVLRAFEQRGMTAILIAEVAAVRPLRADIQELYAKCARALIDDTRQQKIERNVALAYERFGLAPAIGVQHGGEAVPIPSGAQAGGKLEKIVKPLLQNQDAALWREMMIIREGQVCRAEIDGAPIGTGFLVGPEAVLTNYHVLENVINGAKGPAAVMFRFDYKKLPTLEVSAGEVTGLAAPPAAWLIDSSPCTVGERNGKPDQSVPTVDELDYALVRLDRRIGNLPIPTAGADGRRRGWIEIPTAPPSLYAKMPLLILQHPRAAPLKLALDTDAVRQQNALNTRVRYVTNTEAGSSGSPCMDMDWGLVALHHYGDPAFCGAPDWNQGIPIWAIRQRLERNHKADVLET
jgi:hypothetical protein